MERGIGSMWRKSGGTFTALCLVAALGFVFARCGGTGSDLRGFPEGSQFVDESCLLGSCLTLRVSPANLPADGESVATFDATLRNADGSPVVGEEICFNLEDPNTATILEPTGAGCQITNSQGVVSGRLRAGRLVSSVFLIARQFPRSLEARARIRLGDPGQLPAGLTVDANPPNLLPGGTSLISARLTDETGRAIVGATISFSRSPAVGSLSSPTAITGGDGVATVTYNAGGEAANVRIFARNDGEENFVDVRVDQLTPTPTPTPIPPTPTPVGCSVQGAECGDGRPCCGDLECQFNGTNSTCEVPIMVGP
jgi:hypothetical protein